MWLYFRTNFYVKTDSFIFFLYPISLSALHVVQKWELVTRHYELGNFYSGAEVPEREQHFSVLVTFGVFLVTLSCSQEGSDVILQLSVRSACNRDKLSAAKEILPPVL